VLLCFLFSGSQTSVAQSPYSEAYQLESMNCREKITMFTDRDLYAVNESIRFRSFYTKVDALEGLTWSQVLYVELVTPAGLAIARGKYFLEDNGSSGSLAIPADAMTGNYFLRSYTKWMRNFGARSFCYVPLKIINPFTETVLENGSEDSQADTLNTSMSKNLIACRTVKDTYSPGEEVELELALSDPHYPASGSYCLTIFPSGLGDTLAGMEVMNIPGQSDEFGFDYLPDIRGISISGTVVNAVDKSPASYARLHFSILGDQPGYYATLADKQGRFVVSLPDMSDTYELFVAGEPSGDITRTVLVDQDFESGPIPVGTQPFTLSQEEEKAAIRMAINMQLSKTYGIKEADASLASDTNARIPFYGIPGLTILTDDYVDLPTMTEVFENLVLGVDVRYRRGEPYLQIDCLNNNIANSPPLLLVDNIPVFDLRTFLSINPLKIKKIEVVSELFVRGNLKLGGIIILTSKKGDMASVELPEGYYFIDYQAFNPERNVAQISNTETLDRVPDTRNTLLWIDDIILSANETKTLKFSAAYAKGEYNILIRGISNRGDIISGVGRFTVK